MKKRNPIFGIVCLLAMTTALLSGCGCNDNTATPDEAVETSIQTVTEIATDEQGNTYIEEATEIVEMKTDSKSDEKSESSKADDTDDKKDSSSSKSSSSSSSKSGNNSSSSKNSNSSSNKNSSSSKNNSSSSNNGWSNNSSSNGKTWHEAVYKTVEHPAETEKVWVVDQEAYSYEEPVYETHDRTICNVCGADITDCLTAHMRNHALTDGSGGYHNEWVQVQVGTKTVEVPEQGHYETKIIKEAWTEKVLVKEAGYY